MIKEVNVMLSLALDHIQMESAWMQIISQTEAGRVVYGLVSHEQKEKS